MADYLDTISAGIDQDNTIQAWNVPLLRNPLFCGRENLLRQVEESLKHETASAEAQGGQIVATMLVGPAGYGKTQIALEYVYRHQSKYQTVLWIRGTRSEFLATEFAMLAHVLDLPEKSAKKQSESIAAVRLWLSQHTGWLLVIDDMNDPSKLDEYLPAEIRGHVLINSIKGTESERVKQIAVKRMNIIDGALFLLRHAGLIEELAGFESVSKEERLAAENIVRLLNGFPLALNLAGAYVKETGDSLSEYVRLYRMERKEILHLQNEVVSDDLPVVVTWSLASQCIEQTYPTAIELMRLCVFFGTDSISRDMVSKGAQYLKASLNALVTDTQKWMQLEEELLKYGLVERHPHTREVSVQTALQIAVKSEIANRQQVFWAENVVQIVNGSFPVKESPPWWRSYKYLLHACISVEYIIHWQIVMVDAQKLITKLAAYYIGCGQYQQAEDLYRNMQVMYTKAFSAEHLEVAYCSSSLAFLAYRQNRYEQAEVYALEAYRIREKILGSQHPETAKSHKNLAFVRQGLIKREQRALLIPRTEVPIEHIEQAYDLEEQPPKFENKQSRLESLVEQLSRPTPLRTETQSVGEDASNVENIEEESAVEEWSQVEEERQYIEEDQSSTKIVVSYEEILDRYKGLSDSEVSAQIERQRLELDALGFSYVDIAPHYNRLATFYLDQRKYSLAEQLYKQILMLRKKLLGEEHPDCAQSYSNLAILYAEQGKLEQAEPLFQQASRVYEKTLGMEHPDTASSYNNLASLYVEEGKYERARLLYQRALVIQRKVLGVEHMDTANSYSNLATLYVKAGENDKAEQMYQRSLAIALKVQGILHAGTANSYMDLASFYTDQGNYKQAEQFYRQALAIHKKVLGSEHPDTASCYNNLATLYVEQGKYEQAIILYRQALAIFQKTVGKEHPDTVHVQQNLYDLQNEFRNNAATQLRRS